LFCYLSDVGRKGWLGGKKHEFMRKNNTINSGLAVVNHNQQAAIEEKTLFC
jgi:hypothetical protein